MICGNPNPDFYSQRMRQAEALEKAGLAQGVVNYLIGAKKSKPREGLEYLGGLLADQPLQALVNDLLDPEALPPDFQSPKVQELLDFARSIARTKFAESQTSTGCF